MALAIARVSMPDEAHSGTVVDIKALIRHPMETGYRLDAMGRPIPRHIIEHFRVSYGGEDVFSMDLTQGVAANPFFAFSIRAQHSGDVVFTWTDDRGEVVTVTKTLTVNA
ncbi:MAG: thiosulfate oxidation carrier complex protein SoxZ [Gammaproteobacteria bacterium]|nr:thiosulfate oxidation carrier complex protein SoxZ [Gammaproteobacteria bacterium]